MQHLRIPGPHVFLSAAAVGLALVLLIGLGLQLMQIQARSEGELLERFRLRSEIGAKFLAGYVDDMLAKEIEEATAELGSPDVAEDRFSRIARLLGFPAAVLLDHRGRLIAVEPAATDLLGTQVASGYAHLNSALEGRATVSNIVPSAARSVPVVGFAVPFPSRSGTRVFSGALSIAQTTLGSSYLKNLLPFSGSRVYLVDAAAATIASSLGEEPRADLLRMRDRPLWEAVGSGDEGHYEGADGTERFAVSSVEGTPWRLVISAQEDAVLAPVSGASRLLPRLIFAALCLALGLVVILFRELAKSRSRQLAEVERLSITDALTGLYNRRGMELLASQALRAGRRGESRIAIIFMDLDRLKMVNDQLGHDAGDGMLVSTAKILLQTFRDSDVVARVGGDEFCVVGVASGALTDVGSLLSRLEENLARHNATTHGEPQLSLSIGVSWFDPRNPRPLDELIREADSHMYEHKRSKRTQPAHT